MKYISLQDLIDYGKKLRFQSEEQMAKVYEELPSIEIVRCKDCKHMIINKHHENKPMICCFTKMCGTTDADWFCADAKRREDG